MASLTSAGDSVTLSVPVDGTDIDIAISGTYDMTILLQREIGSPNSGAWQTLRTYDIANATVAETITSRGADDRLRLFVSVDTSGTAVATLTDNDNKVVGSVKDGAGNLIVEYKEGGIKIHGAVERADAIVNVTADTTLTAELHAGKTVVLGSATGDTVTLPAATGTGNIYRVAVGVAVTSNAHIVQVANTSDSFVGICIGVDTDVEGATGYTWNADANDDTFTMDGAATGGEIGDFIEVQDIASGVFMILNARITQSGASEATPFSAA